MTKPREIFHSNKPIQIKGYWMLGLRNLEVYNPIFNITEENNRFELYKFPDEQSGGVLYEKFRNEIERDLEVTDITPIDLQDDIIGLIVIKEFREEVTKRIIDDKYLLIVAIYVNSLFQDFESFLRTEIDLVEDDIRLVLDEYNSSFINYHFKPGFYTFKDLSETLLKILQPKYEGYHCNWY